MLLPWFVDILLIICATKFCAMWVTRITSTHHPRIYRLSFNIVRYVRVKQATRRRCELNGTMTISHNYTTDSETQWETRAVRMNSLKLFFFLFCSASRLDCRFELDNESLASNNERCESCVWLLFYTTRLWWFLFACWYPNGRQNTKTIITSPHLALAGLAIINFNITSPIAYQTKCFLLFRNDSFFCVSHLTNFMLC